MTPCKQLHDISAYYAEILGVPPLKITKDVWPQFAYDLLTHPQWGVQHFHNDKTIQRVVALYDRWRKGKKPREAEFERAANARPSADVNRAALVAMAAYATWVDHHGDPPA